MDLANQVAKQYQIHRSINQKLPQPKMQVVQSLYEIALSSYMPTFLTNNCTKNQLDDKTYADLLTLVPDETDLTALVGVTDDAFWARRCARHFAITKPSSPTRTIYFETMLERLLAGEQTPATFGQWAGTEGQVKKLVEVFSQISQLVVRAKPNFQYFPELAKLQLKVLTLQINQKTDTDPAKHIQSKQMVLKAKTLGQIARDDGESVFPFHQFYDFNEKQKVPGIAIEEERMTVEINARCYVQLKDLVGLSVILKTNLVELRIVNSGLTDELGNCLASLLVESKVKSLDLSNNFLNDIKELLKLCSTQQKNFLEQLVMNRNCLAVNSCVQLMKAIKQEQFCLSHLGLAGNGLKEGYLLIINSVLIAANKFNNRVLHSLDLSECSLVIKQEEQQVFPKLFEAGLVFVGLSGVELEGGEEAARVLQDQCGPGLQMLGVK